MIDDPPSDRGAVPARIPDLPKAESAPAGWWHEDPAGIDLAQVLDLTSVTRWDTPHRRIEVHEHVAYGRILTIDGAVAAASEEPAYPEMLAHVPLLGLPDGEADVLIVGAASGILPEVLRHPNVRTVRVWEPDAALVEALIAFFGHGPAFADPRVMLLTDLGSRSDRLGRDPGGMTVIYIGDPSPRRRPGAGPPLSADALAGWIGDRTVVVEPVGVIPTRRGCRALVRDGAQRPLNGLIAAGLVSAAETYLAVTPLSPGGYTAFRTASRRSISLRQPRRDFAGRHYTAALHRAAFALPAWLAGSFDTVEELHG